MRKIHPKDQVYPVCISTRDSNSHEVFGNEIAGGLSLRDHIAIEFAAGMLSNPVLQAANSNQIMKLAIRNANVFAEMLENTPVTKMGEDGSSG